MHKWGVFSLCFLKEDHMSLFSWHSVTFCSYLPIISPHPLPPAYNFPSVRILFGKVANLHDLMPRLLGISLSTSLMWTLKSIGEMTFPWGTPAITWPTLDRAPASLTYNVLPVKKFWVHFQSPRLTPEAASLVTRMAWSTRSNTFRKANDTMCTPSVLQPKSVVLNQSCVMHARAVTVDLSRRNACWLSAISSSCLFKSSWNLSINFATCGRPDIYVKSLFMSTGLPTFGTGSPGRAYMV